MKKIERQLENKKHRLILKEKSGDICFYCRRKVPNGKGTVDHYMPKALGGDDTINNKVFACDPCNKMKGSLTPTHFLALIKRVLNASTVWHDQHLEKLEKLKK